MHRLICCGLILAGTMGSAMAADPTGDWRVKDGVANIRLAICNDRLWGAVSWEKSPGGVDKENPDRAKKTRPTMGMAILLAMVKNPAKDGAAAPAATTAAAADIGDVCALPEVTAGVVP